MIRYVSVFLIVFLLVFLSGCKPREGDIPKNIHKGTKGLEMKFLPNNPPNEITTSTGSDFYVSVELHNEGTSPAKGYLFLSGYDTNIIDMPDSYWFPDPYNCGGEYIMGKSQYNPTGEICVEEMKGRLNLNPVVNYIPLKIPLMVKAIYEYSTDTSISVCVDPNYHQISKKACEMRPVTVSGGQGAPVAVTKIVPIPVGNGLVQFNIHVKNVGGGKVVNVGIPPHELRPRDYNNILYVISVPSDIFPTAYAIEGVSLGYDDYRFGYGDYGYQFSVGGNFNDAAQGMLRLHNDQTVITETVNFGDKAFEYMTPLRVTLFYGYMQDITKNIVINKVPNAEMDDMYPSHGFGDFGLYRMGSDGRKYVGHHEDRYGHDVWRYTDREKGIDISFKTT